MGGYTAAPGPMTGAMPSRPWSAWDGGREQVERSTSETGQLEAGSLEHMHTDGRTKPAHAHTQTDKQTKAAAASRHARTRTDYV